MPSPPYNDPIHANSARRESGTSRWLVLFLLVPMFASAEVPIYTVDPVAEFTTSTTIRGYSENGFVVGDQMQDGQLMPFIASAQTGLEILPLPAGYNAGVALDVNQSGLIVGTVSDSGSPMDFGQPAYWMADGGGWTVSIPQEFQALPSPIGGDLAITGGMIVAVNELGLMVGWSRFQGFPGGPTTLFSATDAPLNLGEMGFAAMVRAINDNNVIAGGQLLLDLDTGMLTEIGVPDPIGTVGFTDSIAFAINNSDEAIVAANLASVPTENYLTYKFSAAEGFTQLNPDQLPSRFVGLYDNNDLGDVSASGGLLFRQEETLVTDIAMLIDPVDATWQVNLGFIANDRTIYTTGQNSVTNSFSIIRLVPGSDQVFDDGFEPTSG